MPKPPIKFISLYMLLLLVRLGRGLRPFKRQGVFAMFCTGSFCVFFVVFMLGSAVYTQAFGESAEPIRVLRTQAKQILSTPQAKNGENLETQNSDLPEPPPMFEEQIDTVPAENDGGNYTVQAVLGAQSQIVLASGIDAKIIKLDLDSGDRFKKGDVLVKYDCSVDYARLNEALSRQRVTEQQLRSYQKLQDLDSASEIEVIMARENNEQNKALIAQIRGRLSACQHVAPWPGRVTRKLASEYEYVQTGRVLMEISSVEPLQAEFLVPSYWLRWLNVGTPLTIYIGETGRSYNADIVSIHGEVDPVSQSVQVVAEMEKYHEELLPGMSGRATFTQNTAQSNMGEGFLGLRLASDGNEGKP
jgi:RND family efflux transporter MFP subunit